jgi:hypothetical protein
MNKLFRDIKENDNLDRLEESDNEEEFEDIREDKYVDLERHHLLTCTYVRKFRLWRPVRHLAKGCVCGRADILRIEKK